MAAKQPTLKELELEIKIRDVIEKERILNKALYAVKQVELLVYGLIGLILVAFVGAIIKLIFLQ